MLLIIKNKHRSCTAVEWKTGRPHSCLMRAVVYSGLDGAFIQLAGRSGRSGYGAGRHLGGLCLVEDIGGIDGPTLHGNTMFCHVTVDICIFHLSLTDSLPISPSLPSSLSTSLPLSPSLPPSLHPSFLPLSSSYI